MLCLHTEEQHDAVCLQLPPQGHVSPNMPGHGRQRDQDVQDATNMEELYWK